MYKIKKRREDGGSSKWGHTIPWNENSGKREEWEEGKIILILIDDNY